MLNLCVRKQREGRKLFFVLLQVAEMELSKECPGVSIKEICMERGRFVVILDELINSLHHEEKVFLKTNVDALVIKVRDVKSLCH